MTFLKHPLGNHELKKKAPQSASAIGLSILQDYNREVNCYDKTTYPICQLSENRLLVYAFTDRTGIKRKEANTEKANKAEKFTGDISRRTKNKILRIVNTWINSGLEYSKNTKTKKPLFTFVTLTLPSKQKHSDNELKRDALNRFLITINRNFKVNNYLWKAEKQKNGNLHFHIIYDAYIPWQRIRSTWNQIMNDLGYIEPFYAKYGHKDPNSTDIHALRNIKNPAAYIAKYLSKNNDKPAQGRLWSCSKKLSNIPKFEFEPDWRTFALIEILFKKKGVYKKKEEYFTIISGNIKNEIVQFLKPEIEDLKKWRCELWGTLCGKFSP